MFVQVEYYRPQGEGNVLTGVCLSTIGLMVTRSLLGLVTVRLVRILLECFLVFLWSLIKEVDRWWIYNIKILRHLNLFITTKVENFILLILVQKNFASSWIDGSVLYGEGIVWAHCLRSFSGGQLMTDNSGREYPGLNHIGVPLDNYPDPLTKKPKKPSNMWSEFV